MAGFTVNQAMQIQGGAPGAAMVGGNTRVKGTMGFLGTQADVLSFANGAVGSWVVANTRTFVQGVPVVSQSAQGMAQPPGPVSPVPVVVVSPDTRIRSM